jgi:hypothetical protein
LTDTTKKQVYRQIEISRFMSDSAALVYYHMYEKDFTRGDWRPFKRDGSGANRYFSGYRPPWMDTNHGIPVGVVDYPDILVAYLKRNVVIVVAYNDYVDAPNYVADMNADIVFVADLVKRSLAPAH